MEEIRREHEEDGFEMTPDNQVATDEMLVPECPNGKREVS